MRQQLDVLCAGAVKGLVQALRERFAADTGADLHARFGAVGAMCDAMRAGEPCDVLIVTDAIVGALEGSAELRAGSRSPIGVVRTGIAVRTGAPRPDISTSAVLKACLLAAEALYFPDSTRSTAGAHFASVLANLGICDAVAARCRMFDSGATAMRELAASNSVGAIGCTQVTEIMYTPGIDLVGVLPAGFELATLYSAAITARAVEGGLARSFITLLSGPQSAALRMAGGFDPAAGS